MISETNKILEKVRAMPPKLRARFASYKSKATHRKKMNDGEAILYAWQRLEIAQIQHIQHQPKPSPLQAFIRGCA